MAPDTASGVFKCFGGSGEYTVETKNRLASAGWTWDDITGVNKFGRCDYWLPKSLGGNDFIP